MKFNERLKKTRLEKGFTQKDIYTVLKVSANCYASWEQGRTQPDIENIRRLCIIYNVTADYLLGLEDEYGNNTRHSYNNYGIHTGDVKF